MYIWILLATIMIGLNFFNLSVRPDKDGAYAEVKASVNVTRFKLENMAVARFLQCETLLRLHSTPAAGTSTANLSSAWDSGAPPYKINLFAGDEVKTASDYRELGYFEFKYEADEEIIEVKPADALPQGYSGGVADVKPYHFIYCMDRPIEQSGARVLNECRYGSVLYPTYVVSFAEIPGRWLSHSVDRAPLPVFVKYLSDETSFSGVAGYTYCDEGTGKCALKGLRATKATIQITEETDSISNSDFIQENAIDENSVIWQNSKFQEICGDTNTPCMLMYKMMPTTDEKAYCRKMFYDHLSETEEERRERAEAEAAAAAAAAANGGLNGEP